MELDPRVLPYIDGRAFSDIFALSVKQTGPIRERMELVEDMVRGKSLLHIGCLDHAPLIESRIRSGTWFHQRLTDVASECLGIDINQPDIDWVREKYRVSNIEFGDVVSPDINQRIIARRWDWAVLGEVLEHIDNPVHFLSQFIRNYGDNVGALVITVPNAFGFSNVRRIFSNLEVINSDHRYWFTPYTIWKVANQAGLCVDAIQLCTATESNGSFKRRIKNMVLTRYPLLCDDIVFVCHPKSRQQS